MSDEERAAELIEAYESRFGAAHVLFALHAAVPIALTPDLALQVWGAFRVDRAGEPMQVPWIAAADLLLSPLVSEAAPELYTMSPSVRRALLAKLRAAPNLGEERLREVATLLLKIGEAESRDANRSVAVRGETQRWTALSILRPEESARSIGAAMNEAGSDPGRWVRFEALLDQLADASESHAALRSLAAGMAELGRGRSAALREHVERHGSTVTAGGTPIVWVPGEALSRLNRRRAETPQAVGPKAEEGDSPREIPPLSGLRVRVVGTSTLPLDPSDQRVAEQLGEALAQRGHVLITGGEAGIEATAAESFARALGDSRAVWARLTHVTTPSSQCAFAGGTRLTGTVERSVEMSDIVVRVGAAPWSPAVLEASKRLGRPSVELSFRDPDAEEVTPVTERDPMGSDTEERIAVPPPETSVVMGARAMQFLHQGISLRRYLTRAMSVIELALRENADRFREYSKQLLDVALTSTRSAGEELTRYFFRAIVHDAGLTSQEVRALQGRPDPSRRTKWSVVGEWACEYPEWFWFDRRLIVERPELSDESRAFLDAVAIEYCQDPLTEELMGAFTDPPARGPDRELLALAQRVSVEMAAGSRLDPKVPVDRMELVKEIMLFGLAKMVPRMSRGYLDWLRRIFVRWGSVPLRGAPEWSDRAPGIARAIVALAPPQALDELLMTSLGASAPEERMVGYLGLLGRPLTRSVVLSPALQEATERELSRAEPGAPADARHGLAWSLLWLTRALLHFLDWAGPDVGAGKTAEALLYAWAHERADFSASLLRLYWWWRRHPEHDLQGDGQGLIRRSLDDMIAGDAAWLGASGHIGTWLCLVRRLGVAAEWLGFLLGPRLLLTSIRAVRGASPSAEGADSPATPEDSPDPFAPVEVMFPFLSAEGDTISWEPRGGRAGPALFVSGDIGVAVVQIPRDKETGPLDERLTRWLSSPPARPAVTAKVHFLGRDERTSAMIFTPGNVVRSTPDRFTIVGLRQPSHIGSPVFSNDGDLLGMVLDPRADGRVEVVPMGAIREAFEAEGMLEKLGGGASPLDVGAPARGRVAPDAATTRPVAKRAVAKKPVAKRAVAKKPVAKKPVAKKPAKRDASSRTTPKRTPATGRKPEK